MRIKEMAKCIIYDGIKMLSVVYGVLIVSTIVFNILVAFLPNTRIGMVGFGGSSVIVLFIFGIIYFYQYIKVGFSFSISRKSVYLSFVLSGVVLAVISAIVTAIIVVIAAALPTGQSEMTQFFPHLYSSSSELFAVLASVVMFAALAFLGMTSGCFIGVLFYRMNTVQKVVVSVGAGFLLPMGLYIWIDLMPEALVQAVFGWIFAIANFAVVSPYNLSLVSIAIAVVFILFFWLLIRRAPVKDK